MNSKTWKSKALSLCLMIATITTYSMVALASPNNVVGEILVSNSTSSVNVNGELAKTGHSIFSSSTIITPNNTDAVVSFGTIGKVKLESGSTVNLSFDSENLIGTLVNGKVTVMSSVNNVNTIVNIGEVGKLKLAPNTSVTLAFDGKTIVGELLAGQVMALNTSKAILIKNVNGKVSTLKTGDKVKAQDDDDDDDCDDDGIKNDDDDDDGCGGAAIFPFVVVFGAAAGLILYALFRGNNDITLGGGTTVVSPVR
ncbi:MAG: hypothetical protein M3405_17335 [Acidobacteriota bacterium]|jgi:hypothetical protein|nr:hypothetical protein [Acidobacteriota bacterium]